MFILVCFYISISKDTVHIITSLVLGTPCKAQMKCAKYIAL